MIPICETQVVLRQLFKRVATNGGKGFRTAPDGFEQCFYTVEVDRKKLFKLALRAAENKRAKSICGPVTVRIINRKPLSSP